MIGLGSLLVPGGNDGLVLLGVPLLSASWVATAAIFAAIAIADVKVGGLMALETIVVAGVSDKLAIGRDGGRVVGTFPIGQRAKRSVSDAEFVDFSVLVFVIGFGMAID